MCWRWQKTNNRTIKTDFCKLLYNHWHHYGFMINLSSRYRINKRYFLFRVHQCKDRCGTYSPPRLSAWTIRGSALLPSRNSSRVRRSSWFLSIWSKILSTRFWGVFSSSVTGCWPCEMFLLWITDFYYSRRKGGKIKALKTKLLDFAGFCKLQKVFLIIAINFCHGGVVT